MKGKVFGDADLLRDCTFKDWSNNSRRLAVIYKEDVIWMELMINLFRVRVTSNSSVTGVWLLID